MFRHIYVSIGAISLKNTGTLTITNFGNESDSRGTEY